MENSENQCVQILYNNLFVKTYLMIELMGHKSRLLENRINSDFDFLILEPNNLKSKFQNPKIPMFNFKIQMLVLTPQGSIF